jgi:glyoxylase-like metal-dependent hydrolase (beta-lactamase superfamily II)
MNVIEQIKVGFDNFCYLVSCPETKKCAVVDPGYDVPKIISIINRNGLDVLYVINTHYHSDHTGGNKRFKDFFPKAKIVISQIDNNYLEPKADLTVLDNESLNLGSILIRIIHTPGHTPGGICLVIDNDAILTGDTLFIGDCGRTDLPGGSINVMFKTLNEKIKKLPDHLIVYPGHDYGVKPFDKLGNQKKTNKVLLAKNIIEFSGIP